MKKVFLLSILALSFSCNNNDDNSSSNNANIIGVWNLVKYDIQYSKDGKIENELTADECSSKSTYTFTAKDYSLKEFEKSNGVCIEYDADNLGTYSVTGNKIKFVNEDNEEGEGEILKLTANELVIKVDYGEDLDNDGKNEFEILYVKR